jgi:GNAT superfamily N-acetyltransferase
MSVQQIARTSEVRVREIPEGRSLRSFIDLQWRLNRHDPNWVAPLRMTVAAALKRKKHPFHRHSEVAYFLAERNGRVVGRIAAIENRLHNEFHEDRVGFFGLFESEDDPEVARALLEAAADWLRRRGLDVMRGPLNFSTNEEVASPGVLVEGFDTRPAIMMSHNPPYYGPLLEGAGLRKVKDVLAFRFDDPEAVPRRGAQSIQRILAREGVRVRPLDIRRFREEVDTIKAIYNSAWSRNWGFVPMTDAEFDHIAREFRPIVDPDLCLIAEVNGEAIGFSLVLPDLNEALRHNPDGRLFPFGLLRLLWYRRRIRGMRVLTLGFQPRYQHAGIGVAFYLQTWLTGVRKGYIRGEASWILEDNLEMVRALERMGAPAGRRNRIYERAL